MMRLGESKVSSFVFAERKHLRRFDDKGTIIILECACINKNYMQIH